jgi:hypothetical protein
MQESWSKQHLLVTPVLCCRQSTMFRIASFLRHVQARTSSTDYSGIHAPVYWGNCGWMMQILGEMHKKTAHYTKIVSISDTNKKMKNKYFDIQYSILSNCVI